MRFLVNCNNTVSQPSTFIRREVIEKVGELDPKFYYFMDWDLWMRTGLYFKIDHIEDVISTYRLHAESKTVAQALKAAPELEYMYNKYFQRTDLPPHVLAAKKKAMMNMWFMTGSYYLKGGDVKKAGQMANRALGTNPAAILSPKHLRTWAYLHFSNSSFYQWLRKLAGKK